MRVGCLHVDDTFILGHFQFRQVRMDDGTFSLVGMDVEQRSIERRCNQRSQCVPGDDVSKPHEQRNNTTSGGLERLAAQQNLPDKCSSGSNSSFSCAVLNSHFLEHSFSSCGDDVQVMKRIGFEISNGNAGQKVR